MTFGQIALTGDPAPEVMDGAEFDSFDTPVLNGAGDVAFGALLRTGTGATVTFGNDSAVFGPSVSSGLPLGLLAREDDVAPGVIDGAEYNSFIGAPVLNDAGDVALLASLRTGTGDEVTIRNNTAIFGPSSQPGSPLGLVIREGASPPGVSDGAVFGLLYWPRINNTGDTAFYARLTDGAVPGVVNPGNDQAVFGPSSGAGSSLGLIARDGEPAPGVSDGALFDRFATFDPLMNAAGDVAFTAYLRTGNGGAVTEGNDHAVFGPSSGPGSPLEVLAREGEPAPGVADGAEYFVFYTTTLNRSGQVAFKARLQTGAGSAVSADNDEALFGPSSASGSAGLGLVAREGAPAPGVTDGAEFESFSNPGINGAGDLAFRASLRSGTGRTVTETKDEAIFGPSAGPGSPWGLVAREGAPAPGAADGAEFGGVAGPAFGDLVLNGAGDVAFLASLRTGETSDPGAVDDTNDEALFAFFGSELRMIVREGDPFEVERPGGLVGSRTIAEIDFNAILFGETSGGDEGQPRSFNDDGLLVFGLEFTDGTEGIFTASLVEESLAGDYDASGAVDQGDLDLVLQNWGEDVSATGVPAGWLNHQPVGLIGQSELDGVLQHWGITQAPDFNGADLPEPSVMVVALAGLCARWRRSAPG